MVVDLDNTYRPYHAIQIIPKTIFLNSHNSVTFQARIPKFCMVVGLNNTNRPYHVIVYHTLVLFKAKNMKICIKV